MVLSPYDYVENLTLGLLTLTYWGETKKLSTSIERV